MTRLTTLKVTTGTRDKFNAFANERNLTADEALRELIWQHRLTTSIARLEADPVMRAEYEAEALAWAGLDEVLD